MGSSADDRLGARRPSGLRSLHHSRVGPRRAVPPRLHPTEAPAPVTGHVADTSSAHPDAVTDALLVDEATRRRRAGRLALALLQCGATRLVPGRPRHRAQVCTAAGLLTAIGARIEVRSSAVAWPRPGTGRVVVANRVSRLDDLALLTVLPDLVVRPETPLDELGIGRFSPARFRAVDGGGATVCPIVIRYRTADGAAPSALLAGEEDLATTLRRAIGLRGLVIQVTLLSPLPTADGDPRHAATLAEYAIAGPAERSGDQKRHDLQNGTGPRVGPRIRPARGRRHVRLTVGGPP